MTAKDGSRTGIVVAANDGISILNGRLGWAAPGLDALQHWMDRAHQDWDDREDWDFRVEKLQRVTAAWAGATTLHAALSRPRAWLNPDHPDHESWPPTFEDTLTLTQWASYQAPDLTTCRFWARHGITDPYALAQWRAAGWTNDDCFEWSTGWNDDDIADWAPYFEDKTIAYQYKKTGMAPANAARWHRNAARIHPATAQRLAERHGWAPTTSRRLFNLITRSGSGLKFADRYDSSTEGCDGDELLCAWADLDEVAPRLALICAAAGLTAAEARDMISNGTLNEAGLRTLVGLRSNGLR